MNSRTRRLLLAGALSLSAAAAQAVTVTIDATGADNFTTTDFWGITLSGDAGGVASVSFDVSGFPDAFFDFDGGSSYNDEIAPVTGALVGLTAGDVSYAFVPVWPTLLTVNFSAGSFVSGDSMRFSADTDFINDPTSGADVAGLMVTVTFADASTQSGVLAVVGPDSSALTLTAAVPEPSTYALMALGLAGVAGAARRRRNV